ncbi:MAG: hypothetical protein V4850_29670 [Myxococcota bacterium]
MLLLLGCGAAHLTAGATDAGRDARTHGGVIRSVDGAHVEVLASVRGVTVYLYDEDLVPADIRATLPVPSVHTRVESHPGRADTTSLTPGPMVIEGHRGFVRGQLMPWTTVDVYVRMNMHPGMKGGGHASVRVPVGRRIHDAPVRHGGVLHAVGDLTVEYLAVDDAHTLWLTDRHGHLAQAMFDVRLVDGTKVWETTADGHTWTVPAPGAGTRAVEVTVEILEGLYLEAASGTFRVPAP